MQTTPAIQEPVAVIGYACRLPGGNTNPHKLWQFLERGGIASNKVPSNRFDIAGHWDGSLKPRTMRPLGGMFLEDTDPADFDASFFEMSRVDAISMDPNQRQMLEVVYECLENAGLRLEDLNGALVGAFVGSFASDYADMQARDPENRPANITVGVGRAILANRLSHFFNIKGPSVTVDTACSGSLIGLDVACRYLQSREINGAIISTSNLYLNPEHVTDLGAVGNAHSPTGLCHTFDVEADGYVKAEAVSAVFLKRLDDAIRDGDPIRGVIRGSSTNSDGRTPGIASPSSEAQAVAIRAAYERAGITDLNATTYLECHGTGTQAGDPTEVRGASSVFAKSRSSDSPLLIGSIKSNVGHAEPAAGISGLIKVLMSIEKGVIPGNPTFVNPSPKIDFAGWKVKASRTAIPWPKCALRRASVNSFGYGGSNVHVVVDQPVLQSGQRHTSSYLDDDDDFDFLDTDETQQPQVLVLSANDVPSLKANIRALSNHLINPRVKVKLADLAYTLSERRSKLFHRAFVTTQTLEIEDASFVAGKGSPDSIRLGFIFTGQGAQWPQMGQDLLRYFPWTRGILDELDRVLQALSEPPKWSLIEELTQPRSAQHLRQPEFSQPLVTALQICIITVLESWGVKPQSVVGHSSGEIAAAYAAGLLSRHDAIKAAFFRGRAAVNCEGQVETGVGMLAVGIGFEALEPFLQSHAGNAWVACFNSPSSLTISGRISTLSALKSELEAAGHFARLLQVDLAYHSELMDAIGKEYQDLLSTGFSPLPGSSDVSMWSSVTGLRMEARADAMYWKTNMVSPVLFDSAVKTMLSDPDGPNFLIEIGPSGALAGPFSQIKGALPTQGAGITYCSSWSRGASAGKTIFDLAGRLFIAGHAVNMAAVNQYAAEVGKRPAIIVDLPNYAWNHSTKYWYENESSKDWRFKPYVHHDLLGSKVLGTSWTSPTWRKMLNITDVPWIKDHKMGSDVLMPGSGFIAMAVEALYQKSQQVEPRDGVESSSDLSYRFRNVRFDKALVLQEGQDAAVMLSLWRRPGDKEKWHEFRISSSVDDVLIQHCTGLVRLQDAVDQPAADHELAPLKHTSSGQLWYKAQAEVGYGFGTAFQPLLEVESMAGKRRSRATVSLAPPASKWDPQSHYPIHPAALDGCFQTVTPSLWSGERSSMNAVLVPSIVDHLVINKVPRQLNKGLSVASSEYSGRGRLEEAKNYFANCTVYDAASGALLMHMSGLRFSKLDVVPKPDPHTFNQILWKPDITFLTQDQLEYLEEIDVDGAIDLISHKSPALAILEVDLSDVGEAETLSHWFARGDAAARAAYTDYLYASGDAKSLVGVQAQWEEKPNASFALLSLSSANFGLPTDRKRDLVVLKVGTQQQSGLHHAIETLRPLIAQGGTLLVVKPATMSPEKENHLKTPDLAPRSELPSDFESGSPASSSEIGDSLVTSPTPGSSASLGTSVSSWELGAALGKSRREKLSNWASRYSFGGFLELRAGDGNTGSMLIGHQVQEESRPQTQGLYIARLNKGSPRLTPGLRSVLETAGWAISEHTYPFHNLPSGGDGVVLVLDELAGPLLSRIDADQWDGLKTLIASRHKLLWVTKGAQHEVTVPENALAPGLFRVIRMEDVAASLTTLDVQSSTSPSTAVAIDQVLQRLRATPHGIFTEFEYTERDGVINVHRVVPDFVVNRYRRAEREGAEPVIKSLHDVEVPVSLRAERLGTFQSLTWAEQSFSVPAVEANSIEVEVMAVGVNFKDVAVTMGIVPENEYTLGYEAAGVVKRLGPGVTKFAIGDRVCFLCNGSYANRLQVPVGRAHVIPSAMSFEDAATIPSVYLASVYSLFDLANLQKGKSVLIHSASGGVGIACIQLCQYMGAEIYVTVGTDEKRQFLMKNYGLPANRIFSSRNTSFAKAILDTTNGRGVDIIINSLTGEMLDESWRICADGGTMVEIGKKDIVDRNTLSMEPFDRNCSFRAMDFSYTKDISDTLIARLLDQIFDLVNAGHIGPVHPITTFGFDEVPAALSHIRSGLHIGKVVISDGSKTDVQVPIRPALPSLQLRPVMSYLIVGGLRGLCGNLAMYMARQGARRIIVASRSGLHDVASQRTIENCLSMGCQVVEARGDVGDASFIHKVFKEANPPIVGVVQGAMILKDKPFELMTVEEYHAAIFAKVRGTWNLHNASLEQRTPLDFLTLLSSISGIVGKKGQSNYSAANTFLDAFAAYRRGLGLRANAVDLGLIEDVGYVAEQGGMDQHFDKRQWTPILEGTLRSIMRYSVLQQADHSAINTASRAQLVTGIGFPLPGDSGLIREARFAYLFASASAADSQAAAAKDGGASQLLRSFRLLHKSQAEPATLVHEAVAILGPQFATIMRLEDDIEPAKPLMAYGVDSLAAVELRNWVRSEFRVDLTTLEITNATSLTALGEKLVARLPKAV